MRMKKIRLQWSIQIQHFLKEITMLAEWQGHDEVSIQELELMVRAGAAVYGPDTHWIETLEQPGT